MLNYHSIRSSEPQIRSNPALKHCSSAFQKNAQTLLEDIQPTFPTYARVSPKHEAILAKHCFYAWKRPAHLRSQWILLDPSLPTILLDCKQSRTAHVLRIPSRTFALQSIGTILCEGAWDAQEHTLWIWDILYWNRQHVWQSEPYSKRWELIKTLLHEILDVGNPMSDATIQTPVFQSIKEICKSIIDPSFVIEFQPEKEGQRRLIFRESQHSGKPATQHAQPQTPQPQTPQSQKPTQPSQQQLQQEPQQEPPQKQQKQKQTTTKILQKVKIVKDTSSRLPDAYRILDNGTDRGLLAIRSLDMSRKLRDLFTRRESCMIDAEWYEPFQKYELKQLYFS